MSSFSQFFAGGAGSAGFVGTPGVVTPWVGNPVTGIFGLGNVQWFVGKVNPDTGNNFTQTFVVPADITSARVRLWGGGGRSGGGFAIKTITGLTPGSSITVTIGTGKGSTTAGTSSSFGAHVSATGGDTSAGGTGVGGDFNSTGGGGVATAGGGAAGLFGNGGSCGTGQGGGNGNAGGGALGASQYGGSGASGKGGAFGSSGSTNGEHGIVNSLDYISTGGGGSTVSSVGGVGANGGGGSAGGPGGFPAGGSSSYDERKAGDGLVIVEW